MPIYRSGTQDWNSLTIAWSSAGTWYDPLADGSGNVTHTSAATDLGGLTWVWPTTEIGADNIGNGGVGVSYSTSTDNITYTSVPVGSFEARYVKTVVDADADVLRTLQTVYNTDIKTTTYQNLDSATLSGSTAQRSTDLSTDFSIIFGLIMNSAASNPEIVIVDVANVAPANVAFSIRDVDTYGKIAVDGVVNITVTGYPTVTLDTATGTVARSDLNRG
tara:strand:- start:361 stop:1017 length:657 start_codon:yes stop_codon:yes gene_type:complete